MLDGANVRSGSRVLDVAEGAGDVALDIAKRVGPNGYVPATIISPRNPTVSQGEPATCRTDKCRAGAGEDLANPKKASNAPTSPMLDINHSFPHPHVAETLIRTGLDGTFPRRPQTDFGG
jgi:hypothetical protein